MSVEAGLAHAGEYTFCRNFRRLILPDSGGSGDVTVDSIGSVAYILFPGTYFVDQKGAMITVATKMPEATYQIPLKVGEPAEVYLDIPAPIQHGDQLIELGDSHVLLLVRT